MNTTSAIVLSTLMGLIVGFTLGQFFDLDLKTWKRGIPLLHLSKRERRRKLPWNRVLGAVLVVVMMFTFVQFQAFQSKQAKCNSEQRRVSAERGAASAQDQRLIQRDAINLGVAIRTVLGQPQPHNAYIDESVASLGKYMESRGVAPDAPQDVRSEIALDWFQAEQLDTIETRVQNDKVRAANPYPEARC
ncbi:hypothetical protein SEA_REDWATTLEHOG_7 [Gordonia phage RedWattleHog]|uniref:Uncharacterized protein n=1 Tax=Gordonia phage Stormageddon TaxID=2656541 RepID=A0A649VQT9_9CAUD|nr:membrane protein [Gordonia phage Stormageddon]QGJ94870.1 hypothetical protein SEA_STORMAGEDDON_7 [Gordonia phage Stormageddon]QLF83511.1 hypothetical protein SEA_REDWATTLEHOG_7 [Gordonia phage RedWattleHog]